MSTDHVDKTVSALETGSVPAWIAEHVRQYQESGGREGHMWDTTAVGGDGPRPCLLLTTLGRRSGKRYTHPLLYGVDDGRYVIVASKGGADTQPNWYFNLLSNDVVGVQVGPDKFDARAALVTDKDRERLWRVMTAVYPPYIEYQSKTNRVIPVFVLARRT